MSKVFRVPPNLGDFQQGDSLVRGGVGLETDTGEFSAIPVTIG